MALQDSALAAMADEIEFLLFDLLEVQKLADRPRFADHSRETFAAVLRTAQEVAGQHFAPHARKSDENEPRFENGRAVVIPEVKEALRHFANAGFSAATANYEDGGMQLPFAVHMGAGALFSATNIATKSYASLTAAAANIIGAFGTPEQRRLFERPMREGRYFGTMVLTEPQAGSSLADLRTAATPAQDGTYRITGNKLFISGGDHEMGENIVHLVLARLPDAPAGTRGISLFIVPKTLVNEDGTPGERNDVALAGLIHKMGWRGTTSAMLNFGEKGGAVGYLVGEPNRGLVYMFHMMNEARINVGSGAAALGYAAYRHALDYARERRQGRPVEARDAAQPQIPIIEHPDIRRMLLAQKAYAEGAVALCLFAATLIDDKQTAASEAGRREADDLLEILTPIVKSWPSQWSQETISLAMQVHGGYGYTREYPVEQLYRENRLNAIHEGTHGIQGLDLLGRKVVMNDARAFELLCGRIAAAADAAIGTRELAAEGRALAEALARVRTVTAGLAAAMASGKRSLVLANASVYLETLGHIVVGWIWLNQALCAQKLLDAGDPRHAALKGKLHACRYFMRWELPRTASQLDRLEALDDTWAAMPEDWLC